MTDTPDLRLGVVGLGMRSDLAELAHRPGAGSRIAAVCDPDPTRRAEAPARFGPEVATTSDPGALAAMDLDAVFVLSPDHTHEEVGVALLEAGVPIFLEKPMAITTDGCDRLLTAARKSGARLYVGHNMRHLPVITAMRELIVSGAVGEVKAIWCRHFVGNGGDFYFKDWHADRRNTTGLLLQKGAHDIDVIHWLADGYTRRVTGMGGLAVYGQIDDRRPPSGGLMIEWLDPEHNWPPLRQTGLNPVVDVEDLSMVHMQLDNGVYASYEQCHFTPDYWRNYTVIGTEGRLENFGDGADGSVIKVWNRRGDYRPEPDLTVPVQTPQGTHGGADPLLVAEFLEFVRHGGTTLTSPVAAREAVATGYAATMSLRDGSSPRDIDPVADDLAEYFATGQTESGQVPTALDPPCVLT
ncbi:Gfo/Idh/MocA family protein [Catenulispora pinisilvae]|uniref:Gfo/Idh/MocA family protein n=1 Tax=Catenulispora pinisilvae TaxID=2705253 RepID=UPI00189225D9|nr:Gfo/Idh/MocA family oxidoreductase [Catenulispora pinisilvae]